VVQQLTQTLQKDKAKEDATSWAAKAVEAKKMDLPAPRSSQTLATTPEFTRSGPVEGIGNSPEFIQASFSLDENNRIYPEIIEVPAGYCVLGFKSKMLPAESEITENLDDLKKEIGWRKQAQSYQAWVKELRKNNKIEYDPEVVN
jgi:peptidyl-prolyl cis-trans isomerase D